MRDYRNLALDILECFDEYYIFIIPRSQNAIADTYAVAASTFKIPIYPNTRYTIEVKHRPDILENLKYWQVFEDDDHIEIKYQYIRDMVEKGTVKLQYVSIDEQVADVLTKSLSKVKFVYYRDKLGVVPRKRE